MRGNVVLRYMLGLNAHDAAGFLANQGVSSSPDVLKRATQNFGQLSAGADPNAVLGQSKYGFTYSRGQRETVPAQKFRQLSKEEALRQTPGGFAAFDAMNRRNTNKLDEALTGLGEQFGSRTAATPAEMVQGASLALSDQAGSLSQRIAKAYEQAGKSARTAVGADAVAAMPSRLRQAVGEFDIHPSVTPVADRTLTQIQLATNETLKGINGLNVKGVTWRALETQRRILNNNIDAASSKTDRAAMVRIKREFDGWLDDAVENALVSGDKAALDSLRDARALRADRPGDVRRAEVAVGVRRAADRGHARAVDVEGHAPGGPAVPLRRDQVAEAVVGHGAAGGRGPTPRAARARETEGTRGAA